MIRRPPRSTLFPTRRSSDLTASAAFTWMLVEWMMRGKPTVVGICTGAVADADDRRLADRKSTRLNSSNLGSSYAVFCLQKQNEHSGPRSHVNTRAADGLSSH